MYVPWEGIPEFAQLAACETDYEDPLTFLDGFLSRWGNFTPARLQQAVREGSGLDRVFAITASGLLASSPESEEVLLPLLHAPEIQERWASAIALGRHQHELAFSALQQILLTKVFDEQGVSLFDGYLSEWLRSQLYRVPLLLGAWGRPEAIVILRQAWEACWQSERSSAAFVQKVEHHERWHELEDRLAYALGQLGAWGVLSTLNLPPLHRQVAMIFLALGSLQINTRKLFALDMTTCVFHEASYSPISLKMFAANPTGPIFGDPAVVAQILLARFGLSEAQQQECIQGFDRQHFRGRLEEDGYDFSDEGVHPF